MDEVKEVITMLEVLKEQSLKSCKDTAVLDVNIDSFNFAIDMAIKLLEQESCEDAISRDELLKAMDTWDKFGYTETGCFVREPKNDCIKYIHYDDVIKCIKSMPFVTPQPKTGHWIKIKPYPLQMHDYECSECSHETDDPTETYCSECGSKMVEPQESERKE